MKKWKECLEKINNYDKGYLITGIEDGWIEPNMDDWHIYCKLKGIDEHSILTWLKKIIGYKAESEKISMSDIELVIKIPEKMYKWICDVNKNFDDYGMADFIDLIKNGTPLPKGHGRIADVDEVIKCIKEVKGEDAIWAISLIDWACAKRTIIEANKESDIIDEIVDEIDFLESLLDGYCNNMVKITPLESGVKK